MERNDNAAESRMQGMIGERIVTTELGGEFTLPDYQPEMKRLLRVRVAVHPADKYIGAGSAEISGTADWSVLYAGEDGAVWCTNQTGDYRFSVPVELPRDFEIGDGLLCDVESTTEQVSGRVTAPRKLAVKCRLRSRVQLYGTRTLNGGAEIPENVGTPERLCGELEAARILTGTGDPLALADEILCDAQEAPVRVICAEGQVLVTEATCGSGVANCRGEVLLKLLCAHEGSEEPPYAILRRIPFSQEVPLDGAEVNFACCASGACPEIRVTVEDGRILCEVSILLSVRAQRNEVVPYVRDLFVTGAECEPTFAAVNYSRAIRCQNGNFSLGVTLPLAEAGMRPGQSVIDTSGTATVDGVEQDRGKCFVTGKCRFQMIFSENGDLSAHELEVPFRYETDGMDDAPTDSDLRADLLSVRVRADHERVAVDAELAVSAAFRSAHSANVLSDVRFGAEIPAQGAVCTICFPARDDTLWSVARRYHAPLAALSAKNRLPAASAADSPDSLSGVKFLVV